ncbi:MAG: PUR family DNA/RNA-binding protein [Bernardetiaceae bacterium]|nr:PUR family DNA/RNA-binding protein [Bernardetiaceae bacterium]
MEDNRKDQGEIFSKRVKAGKRTYFFDVKSTRGNDYYLTITESKKRFNDDGFTYEKHKIFLYKEDFNKFLEALNQTVGHIKEELMPDFDFEQFDRADEEEEEDLERENGRLKWD